MATKVVIIDPLKQFLSHLGELGGVAVRRWTRLIMYYSKLCSHEPHSTYVNNGRMVCRCGNRLLCATLLFRQNLVLERQSVSMALDYVATSGRGDLRLLKVQTRRGSRTYWGRGNCPKPYP